MFRTKKVTTLKSEGARTPLFMRENHRARPTGRHACVKPFNGTLPCCQTRFQSNGTLGARGFSCAVSDVIRVSESEAKYFRTLRARKNSGIQGWNGQLSRNLFMKARKILHNVLITKLAIYFFKCSLSLVKAGKSSAKWIQLKLN